MEDVLFKYNKNSRWQRGRVDGIMIGKLRTMCKVYKFVENSQKVDWSTLEVKPAGPRWIFFCWIPITRIKYLN